MDRLSALMRALLLSLVSLLALACDGEPGASTGEPAAEGRVNAVISKRKAITFADLCDVAPSREAAKPFTWPALLEAAPASQAKYRWVNVWATWCKPCVEELPMLTQTFEAWRKQGHDVTLTLVSVDADAPAARAFIAQHPGVPATLQIADATQTSAWLGGLGLQSGSAIPVHALVSDTGELLCARSGGISAADLERFHSAMFP